MTTDSHLMSAFWFGLTAGGNFGGNKTLSLFLIHFKYVYEYHFKILAPVMQATFLFVFLLEFLNTLANLTVYCKQKIYIYEF